MSKGEGITLNLAQHPGVTPESGDFMILGTPDGTDDNLHVGDTIWDDSGTELLFGCEGMDIWISADMLREIAGMLDQAQKKIHDGTLEMRH